MNLLLLSTTTGYQAQAFAEAARRLGLRVVFGTDRCHVLEDPWQDAALPLRLEDPESSTRQIVEYARTNPLAAVVAVGDRPAAIAALACRGLGIPWHSPEAAALCHDKFRARQRFREAGLPAPAFRCASIHEGAATALRGVRFPCVLKPVALSASRGVIRADNPAQFTAAFARIAALLSSPEIRVQKEQASETLLVEDFVPGREFAVEGLMHRGRLKILAVFDKPDPLDGPFFEETIYVTPARLDSAGQAAMIECLERAAAALGLFHGPLHAEFRLNDRGPWLLEVAARPIGGLCARALRFDGGMTLEEVVIRNSLGEPLDSLEREAAAAGVMMIPVTEEGVFEGVDGLAEASTIPGIAEILITAKPGHRLAAWPEGATYPGFIFARASSPLQVEESLRSAHRLLRFRIARDLRVVR